MGSYLDWLDENWCYSCNDAHVETCEEYKIKKKEEKLKSEERHKIAIDNIQSIEDFCEYIEGLLFSPFRLEKDKKDFMTILYKLKDKYENV